MKPLLGVVLYVFIFSSCAHNLNSNPKASDFISLLKGSDVCSALRESTVSISDDERAAINSMWQSDLKYFEKNLDHKTQQKDSLIKTFLWSRERNLNTFPSGFYLKDSKQTYNDLQKRLDLFKDLEKGLTPPSLLKHILQQEIKTFSIKDGAGAVSGVVSDYVGSFILHSAPSDYDFKDWLLRSCP